LPNLKFAKLKNTVFWPKFPNLVPTIWYTYTVHRVCTVTHQTQSVDSCLYYNWRELETTQKGDNLICRQQKILHLATTLVCLILQKTYYLHE